MGWSEATTGEQDPRRAIGRRRRRQGLFWLLLASGILGLLSIFSAGFFLYAVVATSALAVLATVFAASSLGGLELTRHLERTEITVGEAVKGRLAVRNTRAFPVPWLFWSDWVDPGLDVEGATACFKTLGSGEPFELNYRLHSLRRGLFRIGPAVVESSGPFGLVRRFRVSGEAAFLTVLPRSVPIGRGWPLGHRPIHEIPRRRSLFEDPSRFRGVRPYQPGDPLRRIHWRATARSGKLQVKLFDPAVLEGMLLAVEMSRRAWHAGADALPQEIRARQAELELVVTAAASLADFVLAGGQSVGVMANGLDAAERFPEDWQGGTFRRLDDALAEGSERRLTGLRPLELPPAKGEWQRSRVQTALARLMPASGATLPELLLTELPRLPRSLVLMVVTPVIDGALGGSLESLARSGIEAAVVWVTSDPEAEAPAGSLPEQVPVYIVGDERDLEQLGTRRL